MRVGGWRASLSLLTLGALLLTPGASAASVAGDFLLHGTLTLPAGAGGQAAPEGMIYNDSGNLLHLGVRSPVVHVCKYEATSTTIQLPEPLAVTIPSQPEEACFPLRDVDATLESPGEGWVGFDLERSGTFSLSTSYSSKISATARSAFASSNVDQGGTPDTSVDPWFYQPLVGDQVIWSVSGTADYAGPGRMKFMGPTLRLVTPENTTRCETGIWPQGPAQHLLRWCNIEWDQATVSIETSTQFDLAAKSIDHLVWDGKATFEPRSGTLHAGEGAYLTSGKREWLDGRFRAHLTFPQAEDVPLLHLEGELRATSMKLAENPVQPMGGSGWGFALPVVAAALVGGASVAAWVGIRRRVARAHAPPLPILPVTEANLGEPYSAEDCHDASAKAFCAGDFARALIWVQRTRKLAPTSVLAAFEEGTALIHLGELEGALRAFEDAHNLGGQDPEDVYAAVGTMEEAGASIEILELWLRRAVEAKPSLIEVIEDEFPAVVARESWNPVGKRAWARFLEDGEPKP